MFLLYCLQEKPYKKRNEKFAVETEMRLAIHFNRTKGKMR